MLAPLHDKPVRNATPMVSLTGVTVSFDGFKALDINSLVIDRNELRVVIGPNGAGKTTMCDVISGKTRAVTGKVMVDGIDVTRLPDVEIAALALAASSRRPPSSTVSPFMKTWSWRCRAGGECGAIFLPPNRWSSATRS